MRTLVIVDVCEAESASLALAPLGRASALNRVLERAARIPGADALACLLSNAPEHDELAEEAEACDALVLRGDPADALRLAADAASDTGADVVLRVSADRPFLDPALCARVLTLLLETDADYACNDLPASWPHGLDCEAFSARLLHWADHLADHPGQRARPGHWIRTNSDLRKACLTGPGGDFARMRWTLHWPEDLAFAQAVFAQMGEGAASANASELASFCLRRPDLCALNAARGDKARLLAVVRADIETAPVGLVA
jgi:spore coat polysaccharide biosynthesis protein SpsF (cytidylyltransferase family)